MFFEKYGFNTAEKFIKSCKKRAFQKTVPFYIYFLADQVDQVNQADQVDQVICQRLPQTHCQTWTW